MRWLLPGEEQALASMSCDKRSLATLVWENLLAGTSQSELCSAWNRFPGEELRMSLLRVVSRMLERLFELAFSHRNVKCGCYHCHGLLKQKSFGGEEVKLFSNWEC